MLGPPLRRGARLRFVILTGWALWLTSSNTIASSGSWPTPTLATFIRRRKTSTRVCQLRSQLTTWNARPTLATIAAYSATHAVAISSGVASAASMVVESRCRVGVFPHSFPHRAGLAA